MHRNTNIFILDIIGQGWIWIGISASAFIEIWSWDFCPPSTKELFKWTFRKTYHDPNQASCRHGTDFRRNFINGKGFERSFEEEWMDRGFGKVNINDHLLLIMRLIVDILEWNRVNLISVPWITARNGKNWIFWRNDKWS